MPQLSPAIPFRLAAPSTTATPGSPGYPHGQPCSPPPGGGSGRVSLAPKGHQHLGGGRIRWEQPLAAHPQVPSTRPPPPPSTAPGTKLRLPEPSSAAAGPNSPGCPGAVPSPPRYSQGRGGRGGSGGALQPPCRAVGDAGGAGPAVGAGTVGGAGLAGGGRGCGGGPGGRQPPAQQGAEQAPAREGQPRRGDAMFAL